MRTDCIEPNAENASEAELLAAMEAAPNKRSFVRLSAIRALLKGYTHAQVSELYNRGERLLRLWIILFNRGGIDAAGQQTAPETPP